MSRPKPNEFTRNDNFKCANCDMPISAAAPGSHYRNHCPYCLHSLHVDRKPGDRLSLCRGLMKPISLWSKEDGETALLVTCTRCGIIKSNRIAGDDNEEALRKLTDTILKAVR